jgi:hypothetical protein
MAYLDYKVTDWKRLYIPNEKVQEVQEIILNNKGHYAVDDILSIEGVNAEDIEPCIEPMLVSDNGGSATIEIFNDVWDTISTNAGV